MDTQVIFRLRGRADIVAIWIQVRQSRLKSRPLHTVVMPPSDELTQMVQSSTVSRDALCFLTRCWF